MADSTSSSMSRSESQRESAGSCSAVNSIADTNDRASTLGHLDDDDEMDFHHMKSGWLMKRSKVAHKWRKQWFSLKRSELFYGEDSRTLNKCIALDGAEISETDIDKKRYAFRLKPKGSSRNFFVHADNENDQQEWMQAICFAKAASHHGDRSQACVIQ